MSIEPFKYLLQPVAVERDDETGRAIREIPGEMINVYSVEQAIQVITGFEEKINEFAASEKEDEDEHQRAGVANGGGPARRSEQVR